MVFACLTLYNPFTLEREYDGIRVIALKAFNCYFKDWLSANIEGYLIQAQEKASAEEE